MEKQLQKILKRIDALKKKLDSLRPLEGENIKKFHDYVNEVYTYESNSIEGNTLTLSETSLVINKGITISGKSLREHFEVSNHIEAIKYIEYFVAKKGGNFNEKVLLDIHYLILKSIESTQAGKYRNANVMISGTKYTPPNYIKIQNLMNDYFNYYIENKNLVHPVIFSANLHEKLVTIHPFIDGNGRTARLIMNLILLQNGLPITSISNRSEQRRKYYDTLQIAQIENNTIPFQIFIAENVERSMKEFLEIVS